MFKIIEILKQKIKKIFKLDFIALNSKESDFDEKNNEEIKESEDIEKKEFFEIYKKVKNGTIKLENLMINDLIKVQMIMQQEKEFLDNKIYEEEKKIEEDNKKISKMQKNN